jgi:hypothetical protein
VKVRATPVTVIAAAVIAATVIGVGADAADAGGGSLSVSPGIVENAANPGSVGSITISNTTAAAIAITVTPRPWLQARNGEVAPNRGATLPGVGLSASSFTLAAGASQTVAISLTSTPPAGSLYGALEVTSGPYGKAGGIRVAYRLVSILRLDAPRRAQLFRARAGGLIERGNVKHGKLLLAVRNRGNTIVPIGGVVRISGAGHSLRASATAKTIVPGATVNVPLTQLLGSLPRGRYRVSVSLTEGRHHLGAVHRTVTLR